MANANVKMSVTGVQQFKNDIKSAEGSVKTLDAELKLAEAQFKATGDKETYMQTKTQLLKKKLEEQQKAVDAAEQALKTMKDAGVDPASTAFQTMQTKLANAKANLLDTKTQLDNVGTAGKGAADEATQLGTQLESVAKHVNYDAVIEGIGKITSGMEAAAKKAFQLGEALVKNTLGGGAWADELLTTATQYEITPEELQRIRKTADLIDTSAEAIVKARQRMLRGVGKGTKETMAALESLGVEYAGDAEDTFWKAGEAIMKLGDEAEREAAANALYGKSWHELLPLFKAGREEYEKTKDAQSVVSKEALDNLGKMDDQYQNLTNEIETLKMEFLSELAPATTQVMETLTNLVKEFNTYLQSEDGQKMMQSLSDAVTALFSDLSKVDPAAVMDGLKGVLQGITDGLRWIMENADTVKMALLGMVGAWGSMKIGSGITTVLKLINGLKFLKNNPNIPIPGGGGAAGGGGATAAGAGKTAGGGFLARAASMAGAGSTLAVTGTLAGLGVAGYAGAKMIDANLNDENLNAIYGDNGGTGDLIETMGEKATAAAAAYWQVYSDEMKAGSEEAFNARDALFAALDEEGYENAEQGVSFLEGVFDEALNGTDWDGLVEKANILKPEIFQGEGEKADTALAEGLASQAEKISGIAITIGENASVGLANGIDAQAGTAIAAAQNLAAEVANTLRDALKIQSPSKVMAALGAYVSEGFAEGIESGISDVTSAVDNMAGVASSAAVEPGRSGGRRMIDITLMLDSNRLTEVVVPLVDSSLGESISLARR